jgi:peptide/nickel transport system permease protein
MNNDLLRMIGKRIVQSAIVIVLVTFVVFILIKMVPGDPILNFLGPNATEESIAYYTHLYGYDKPLVVQYFKWMQGLLTRGEMGFSVFYQADVSTFIFERLGVTLNIVAFAFIIAVVFGIIFGVIAALQRGKILDSIISFVANIGVSMPAFWIGIILIYSLAMRMHLLPTSGYTDISQGVWPWLRSLIMPVLVVAFSPLASFTRQTRSSMLEVLRQDYVVTAKSKGLKHMRIILKHQLKNGLIPIVTIMGTRLGGMLGDTVLVESVFVLPGLGGLLISGIRNRDYMIVADSVMIIAVFVALCNLLVDILYGIIDPRIRNH